jgi:hypothetical protein
VSQLAATLEGVLGVSLSKGGCTSTDGVTMGPTFNLGLRTKNAAPKTYGGAVSLPIDSSAAYVTLPMQPGQRGAVVYVGTGDNEFLLRLTFEDSTTDVLSLQGLYLQEFPTDNLVTLIEVQGVGTIAWHASGPLA